MIAVAGADQAPPAANVRPHEASVALAPAQPVEFAPPPAGPAPGSVPGESRPAADPAPPSDSEVDPFSTLGTAEFSTGRLDVRFGRKVKTRRPKIGLAGKIDLFQGRGARVVLKISVDATGKVTDVGIIKSSGSNEIDQPCRVAVYDWWFEPKRDAAGNAVADDFQFTIVWH
jgi:TonB family protein